MFDQIDGIEGKCEECGLEDIVFDFCDQLLCDECLGLAVGVEIEVENDVARPVEEET